MSFTDKSCLRTPPLARRQRLGFVGGGRGGLVGDWHFAGARLSNHWDVVAGALSSRPDNAVASARDWMIPPQRSYSDFRQMAQVEAARADGIEAVAICTPNWNHAEIAACFLKAGIDVILDKPMTTTMADAKMLVALQRQTGVSLTMTYPYAHHAMVRQARAIVDSGLLGTINQVHLEYLQEWNCGAQPVDTAVWRQDPSKVGRSSIVGDIGTHAHHLLKTMTGLDVSDVRADMFVCGGRKPQPDTAHINLRLSNSAPGLMHLSNATPGQYCGLRIRVWGSGGAVEWDQERPEYLKFTPLEQQEQTFVRGVGNGVLGEAERLVHLPRGHGEALTDAWANLYAEAALVIAARRAGRQAPAGVRLAGAAEGLAGMRFIDGCADSYEAGGAWIKLQHDE
ncbi:Gfo/Idh/MocA family protein [Mesorhizobium sp. B4-1-4]|uniref:Gfo/Idh/MocA family protein n=1 Tax=Mesorhizobium sp. B4-1-4 TaxID=2589888 RepID=UPI00112B086B|nr:Gfo/Idh/MocA family oxidoreductase [Mesorhizobium sp. B4-1-4]UCI31634.1 Gfo/Idh/MocA family oxidoreductase [Mesorhizobium sp. B4-1-4]